MRRLAARLFRDHAGATALTFALLTPLLVLLGGGTVDVVNASMRQSNLQQAADAAAVGAVARYSPGYQAALTMTLSGPVSDSITVVNDQAIFTANRTASTDTTVTAIAGSACGGSTLVCKNGTAVQSKVSVTGTFTTSFLGLIGQPSIKLAATSQATANIPTYINYYIIVDTSQSMGIAATPADMQTLYNRVATYGEGTGGETGCVFGCHVPAYRQCCSGAIQPISNEDLAHNTLYGPRITLRIDAAVTAIQNIITQAQNTAGSTGNIQFALYTMSGYQKNGSEMTAVSPLSADYTTLSADAYSNIDLGSNDPAGYGDSDFATQLTQFNAAIPASGTGLTSKSPLNYVFIITDGLKDTNFSSHSDSAFDRTLCQPIKAKASVGVIYTTYIPITSQPTGTYNPGATNYEGNYLALAAPYLPPTNPTTPTSTNIPSSLLSCASNSSLYFEASDGPDLISAMAKLFAQTQKTARLAQ